MQNQGGNTNRPRRVLTPEQKRRILEKRRKARMKKRLMIIVPVAVVVVVLVVVLALTLGGKDEKHASDAVVSNVQQNIVTENTQPEAAEGNAAVSDAAVQPEGAAATPLAAAAATNPPIAAGFDYDAAYKLAVQGMTTGPELVYDYYDNIDPAMLPRWSEANPGHIPVLHRANTDEKIIAVTVDDCFQGENLMQIVQCAEQYGADLTIFPIGDNLDSESVANALRYAYETGHEIGNHTYNHAGMYHYNHTRMQQEIWYQMMKVNETLGVNYTQHFFRPKGGDERNDQRVHAYLNQLGYDAVAMWTQSGSTDSLESLYKNLAPGRIYLFHTTTNHDLKKLLKFIPGAIERGYKLVTLSEMFGLPQNEVSELTLTTANEPPLLEAFDVDIPTLVSSTYIRAAAVVQQRLIELGWMDGEATGVYGKQSQIAVGFFQKAAGMEVTGEADLETQKLIFSTQAPQGSLELIQQYCREMGTAVLTQLPGTNNTDNI